jgi:uncharacterized protein (TIGR02246 family)
MKRALGTIGFLLLVVAPAAADVTMTCKNTTKEEIAALFDRWNNSLKTLDPKEVVKNYSDDAILLATVSNKPRLTQDERIDYFEHFLEKKPVGQIDMRVIKIGCNDAIDSGLYTFTFDDGSKAQARYTFTYELSGQTWLISSHHSSVMPEAAK